MKRLRMLALQACVLSLGLAAFSLSSVSAKEGTRNSLAPCIPPVIDPCEPPVVVEPCPPPVDPCAPPPVDPCAPPPVEDPCPPPPPPCPAHYSNLQLMNG